MMQQQDDCKTYIQVIDSAVVDNGDGESIVKHSVVDCANRNFTFFGVQYGGDRGNYLIVCVWQEIRHSRTSEKQCTRVKTQNQDTMQNNKMIIKRPATSDKSDQKLPLILTLIFLCVGIFGLVILHHVVKGYLSDRRGIHSMPTFFCSLPRWRSRHSSWRNNSSRNSNFSYKTTNIFAFQPDDGGGGGTNNQ